MELNWTPEVFFYLFEAGTLVISLGIILLIFFRGNRYRCFIYFALAWAFYLARYAFQILALLLTSIPLYVVGIFMEAINLFLLLLAADSLSRDAADPVKLSIYLVLIAIMLILGVLTPNPVILLDLPGGGTSLILNGNATLLLLPTSLLVFFVWLVVIIKVLRQSPRTFQQPARLFFIGFLINTIIPLIMGQTSLQSTWPGLNSAVAGIGVLVMTIPIAWNPKILFILPLKALRLTVLHTGSGIMLFNHTWDASGAVANEELYTGMLQGVNLIFKESLNQGDVQEVRLANAVLLTHRSEDYPVACVLVAGKVSRTLRDALKLFARKFYAQFADCFPNYNKVDAFAPASGLVAECFPFVPDNN